MFSTRLLISLAELGVMILASALIIVLIYRIFLRANPDFDMEDSIRDGNLAVGILMGSIMISAALMLNRGLEASIGVLRLALAAPVEGSAASGEALLLIVGHLVLSLAIAVITISVTLRLFGLFSRRINPQMQLGKLLEQGNIAVGILLAAVVFIATLYVGDGISAVTKALVPQPQVGSIRIMQ